MANAAVQRLADQGAVDFTVLKAEGGYLLKTLAIDGRADDRRGRQRSHGRG